MEFGSFCTSYLWKLHNFSELGVTEKELQTPSVNFLGVEWLMKTYICDICENGDFSILVSLVIETAGVHKPKVYWRMSLMTEDGGREPQRSCEMCCLKSENLVGFKVSRRYLQHSENLLPYDCLTICLDLVALDMFTSQNSWKNFQANELSEPDYSLKFLSRDFLALLQSEEQADVVLHVGNQSFLAHKLILAVRSKVFRKIFLHNAEGRRQNIFLDNIEACDAKLMLEYIYSGTLPEIPIERVRSLLMAAVNYGVMDLQRMCIQLKGKFAGEDVAYILDLKRQISEASKKQKTNISRDLLKRIFFQFLNKLMDYFIHGVLLVSFLLFIFSHILS